MKTAPFGSWNSPIAASALTSATVGLSEPRFDGNTLYWLESRPEEKGRTTIVRLQANGETQTLLPRPLNVRSKVNEYGGGSYCVHDGVIYFVLADDQRIYKLDSRLDSQSLADGRIDPQPLTPEGPRRYADLIMDAKRRRLLAVCEDHSDQDREPETYVVAVPLLDNESADNESPSEQPQILLRGRDFFSSLDLSVDGDHLCWLCWDHPNMPWDNCECWVAEFDAEGQIKNHNKVSGDSPASIFQPRWSLDDSLYYVSDRSNWWNIYRHRPQGPNLGPAEVVLEKNAEFASPQWVFGLSTYDFINDNTLVCCYSAGGRWHLGIINVTAGHLQTLTTELTDISYVRCDRESRQAVFLGSSPEHLPNLYRWSLNSSDAQSPKFEPVAQSSSARWDPSCISAPETIEFPTSAKGSAQNAHAFFYSPKNTDFCGPPAAKPPLIVLCHGGPTAAAHSGLNLKIQYWTSRGFAVVDINYRGSTGYGRHYRQQLNGQWGVADVEDAAAAVNHLAEQGRIDPNKSAIKGSSAGGYTVLAALTFTEVFKAGASLYGIGDLETLARDTHKFESRYMDTLVGPYPQQQTVYRQRSPIHSVSKLSCPVIFFQGLEDKVVPPNQARTMVAALDAKHIPVAYVEFPEEGHGFRQAANIVRALEAELYFYSRVFDFPLADIIEPVTIKNLPQEMDSK